jgi:glycosyltransferase involved in cell wall biosynthesis
MTPPLISCIVPVYNGERYLAAAIANILEQTYQPLELIVVDDGSSDGTPRVIEGFGAALRSFQQPNQGHAAARNLGLRHARGPLIAFQDADDLWHPRKLERQMALLGQHPGAGGCVSHVQNFWDEEDTEAVDSMPDRRRPQTVVGFTIPCLLAHRWVYDRVGVFDTSLGHTDDTEWFLRVRRAAIVIEIVPEVLCYRRMHATNRSRVHADESLDEYLLLLKKHLDKRRSENG